MRWTVALLAVCTAASCAAVDKHVLDYEPPEGWCENLPHPFLAKYADGAPFLEVKALEGAHGAIEATYHDRTGTPLLVERSVKGSAMYFALFYPSGQKHIAGAYKIEEQRFIPQSHWEVFSPNGTLETGELPDDFFEYQPMLIDGQGPDNYPEPRLYEGFPSNACYLVCADREGKLAGAFPLERVDDIFVPATQRTVALWKLTPRKIAGTAVPDCALIKMRYRR